MTAIEKVKEWISTFPGYNILEDYHIDYTDQIPSNGGIFPSGLAEVERGRDVTGKAFYVNRYNFGLYYVFQKAPGDDAVAQVNADWIMAFQEWVQEQSANCLVPQFGDGTLNASAGNGVMYDAEDEGTATYMVQLSIDFEKGYD